MKTPDQNLQKLQKRPNIGYGTSATSCGRAFGDKEGNQGIEVTGIWRRFCISIFKKDLLCKFGWYLSLYLLWSFSRSSNRSCRPPIHNSVVFVTFLWTVFVQKPDGVKTATTPAYQSCWSCEEIIWPISSLNYRAGWRVRGRIQKAQSRNHSVRGNPPGLNRQKSPSPFFVWK